MGLFDWDFSKLPKSEHKKAIKAYNISDIDILVKLHNDYKLSKNNYCCNPDQAMLNWFSWAIDKKIISEDG